MKASLRSCRSSLLISAALLLGVALAVAVGVIPPARTDTFPLATPERAVPAFWVNFVFNLTAAAILGLIAIRIRWRSHLSTSVLVLLAIFILLFTLALVDAAFAYRSHGPSMQTATTLLFFCGISDFLAALLVIATAVRFPKRT